MLLVSLSQTKKFKVNFERREILCQKIEVADADAAVSEMDVTAFGL